MSRRELIAYRKIQSYAPKYRQAFSNFVQQRLSAAQLSFPSPERELEWVLDRGLPSRWLSQLAHEEFMSKPPPKPKKKPKKERHGWRQKKLF